MPKRRTAVDQWVPVCFLQYFRVLISLRARTLEFLLGFVELLLSCRRF